MNYRNLLLALVLASPMMAWGLATPTRLLLPHLNGVVCDGPVCVEDPEQMARAAELYRNSLEALSRAKISLEARPIFVYCSSTTCYRSFGGGNERAISFPYLGTVIAPTSWQRYITMHELVHWYQFEKIGAVATMLKPEWFREGMAYVYSGAPETDIPEHYLPMMERYRQWQKGESLPEMMQRAQEL